MVLLDHVVTGYDEVLLKDLCWGLGYSHGQDGYGKAFEHGLVTEKGRRLTLPQADYQHYSPVRTIRPSG